MTPSSAWGRRTERARDLGDEPHQLGLTVGSRLREERLYMAPRGTQRDVERGSNIRDAPDFDQREQHVSFSIGEPEECLRDLGGMGRPVRRTDDEQLHRHVVMGIGVPCR